MATKITLDDPTGSSQWIADIGLEVENGETVEIENDDLAKGLLQNPIWKEAGRPDKAAAKQADGEGA